ncbi:glycosyl hydrolase family 28-related protein [Nannocystis sp. ILAH1]|uniref:glycosyl hydrolase family 28-related protein n=1 Tax=unclassified Nannocystis TaxID=2627009 RepID=UPI0022716CEA|nr:MULTISPECIES: glycosyl hydrolase family 28-related protein [unclassified Nannocystis]MCY0991817.1 glycosyl hydrolase family 28-related protein [Nannocystis sp. ILAH1]MCY1067360.1 glycosyl hydrolase family 28-related protein [Nannocystis sp. RBIL2]
MRRFVGASLVWLVACGGGDGSTGATTSTAEGPSTGAGTEATSTTTGGATSESPTDTGEATSTTTSPTSTTTSTTDASSTTGEPVVGWRSELYPEDWTPEFSGPDGRFLHDFSYAGYRLATAAPGSELPALTIDAVRDHGADATGMSDATAALQAALDAAAEAGGAVVRLPAGLYRVDGRLTVKASNTVIAGVGAEQSRLWFTAFSDMSFEAHLTFAGAPQLGADVALAEDGQVRARTITVADASGLKVGDEIAIGWQISPAFVTEHEMNGTWMVFNDSWQPFFWRTVTAVDPGSGAVEIDVPLRYPALVRDQASVRPVTGLLREVALMDVGVANAVGWEDAWSQDQVYAVAMLGVRDAWVTGVKSFVSPGAPGEGKGAGRHLQSGGLTIQRSARVTVADSTLELAQHRGDGGNGYLFEVMQSGEVLVRDCVARAGRHNFVQNWGFGATGIVWLRVHSSEGKAVALMGSEFGTVGLSEFHHSLATANLLDQSVVDDGWGAVNRLAWSSGAGHSATQSAVWNASGKGVVRSRQFGHGYVIGVGPQLTVETSLESPDAAGTAPEDWVEGPGQVGVLDPPSLYEDQLARRLGG